MARLKRKIRTGGLMDFGIQTPLSTMERRQGVKRRFKKLKKRAVKGSGMKR